MVLNDVVGSGEVSGLQGCQQPLMVVGGYLLLGAGVVTALPMVLYSAGVRYLPLTTAGFCQYLSPTLGIFCGMIMGEYLTPGKLRSFYFIWAGVILYCLNTIYEERKRSHTSSQNI